MTEEKSIFVFAIAALLTIFSAGVYAGTYSGGTGEPNDPYLIVTAEDMNEIGADSNDWDKHFLMVVDINLADYNGTEFNIIGDFGIRFKGVFDGNDHKVWNFSWDSSGRDYIGLFGCVDTEGQIKNLGLENIDVNAVNGSWVGGLVGWNRGSISNCYVAGTVKGPNGAGSGSDYYNIGGLVGYNFFNGSISNSYVVGCVSGIDFYTGGLLGTNNGTVSNCYAATIVSGKNDTAGLVGHNCHGTVSNCYATGSVSGYCITGGLVGHNCFGTISNCYAVASVDGDVYTGGLVGRSGGTVSDSFWDIQTSGQSTSDGGEGKTTAQMQTESTFTDAGWDFIEIWDIGENQTYPFLRTHPASDINHDDIVNFYDFAILADHWLQSID